jgi:perosamine synthetase
LSLEALGVHAGDEVLVPAITFASAAAVVIHLGAQPVFVDCLPDTLCIDPEDLERRITPRTKVIAPMHYGGQPCQMNRIVEIAKDHRLSIVEDAAHALPASYNGQKIGTIGNATCFSFYANKTITTGEGGMITTDDPDLARRIRLMSYHGISRDCVTRTGTKRAWRYEVVAPGYKVNMTDIAASLGVHQLSRCDDFRDARRRCADLYKAGLASIEAVRTPVICTQMQSAWHLYVIQLDLDQLGIDRDRFSDLLEDSGIGTSVHFLPLHMHPWYRDNFHYAPNDLPNSTAAYERILSLPIFPSLRKDDIEYIVDNIASITRKYRR